MARVSQWQNLQNIFNKHICYVKQCGLASEKVKGAARHTWYFQKYLGSQYAGLHYSKLHQGKLKHPVTSGDFQNSGCLHHVATQSSKQERSLPGPERGVAQMQSSIRLRSIQLHPLPLVLLNTLMKVLKYGWLCKGKDGATAAISSLIKS